MYESSLPREFGSDLTICQDNDKVADTEGAVDTFENYTNFYSIMDAMGIPTNTDEVPDIVDTSTTTLSESENYYNSQETLLGDSYPFPSSVRNSARSAYLYT